MTQQENNILTFTITYDKRTEQLTITPVIPQPPPKIDGRCKVVRKVNPLKEKLLYKEVHCPCCDLTMKKCNISNHIKTKKHKLYSKGEPVVIS